MSEQAPRRRLAAILAADVVGYSRMMQADFAGQGLRPGGRAVRWDRITGQEAEVPGAHRKRGFRLDFAIRTGD